jgi:hypothetical protein
MYLRIMPNLLHFLPDLNAFYAKAMRPTFMKSTPGQIMLAVGFTLIFL